MIEEELLYMGFVKSEISLKYHLPRNRFISILSAGTPNEVVFLCSRYADSGGVVDDLVCVHNFDYDGALCRDMIDYLINYFERDWRYDD